MGQSYRIRTELGVNKTINVQIDQEFEFLEILSLKLQQEDIYVRACSDYGVLVGRVTANNGLGVPNARVAVFIPIDVVDQSNPIITSIYPYKSVDDRIVRASITLVSKAYIVPEFVGMNPNNRKVYSVGKISFTENPQLSGQTNPQNDFI